jgi:hypothetical protein
MSSNKSLSEYDVSVISRHCESLLEAAQSAVWTSQQSVRINDCEYTQRQLEYWINVKSALKWTIEQAKQRQRKSNHV